MKNPNMLRHQYRPLEEGERADMQAVKDLAVPLIDKLEELEQMKGRVNDELDAIAIAKQHVQEAIFWATYYVTG